MGPGPRPQFARFAHMTPLCYVSNFRPQNLGPPLTKSWIRTCLSLLIVEEGLEIFRKHVQNGFCFFSFRFNLARLTDMGRDICPESLYIVFIQAADTNHDIFACFLKEEYIFGLSK